MATNIFVGQTEAPLLVRPYIATMTRSEIMAVMVGGFATVSGGVMGAYVMFLRDIPNIAGHLMTASIISAPAAFVCAKLMIPETEEPLTRGEVRAEFPQVASNAVEAAARGARDGLELAFNVAGMLIAFVALVAMADFFIGLVPVTFCGGGRAALGYQCVVDGVAAAGEPLSLSRILGWVFAPIAFVMGVPMGENIVVGRLLGEKTVLTEFIAYISLGELVQSATPVLSERGSIIASYALCGFANFASIGIQIGGLGGMAPSRMADVASLGFRGMVAGTLAACMTGAVVGIMV
jgi:CNT family concentrative nucleoside transporter